LIAPALPNAARQIWRQLGCQGDPLELNPADVPWGESRDREIKIGQVTGAFPKLAKDKIMAEIENERAADSASQAPEGATQQKPAGEAASTGGAVPAAGESARPSTPPLAPTITIDDFARVDLRVATVITAERVPKADKLLRLEVDLGEPEHRQILAGIAQYYSPEDIVGRKIIVVANLAPRKLRGLESNGMLLAASIGEEGRPVLATFTEDVPNGARLK